MWRTAPMTRRLTSHLTQQWSHLHPEWTELTRLPIVSGNGKVLPPALVSSPLLVWILRSVTSASAHNSSPVSTGWSSVKALLQNRISSPPTVNPPLQMSYWHCPAVLQSVLAFLWLCSECVVSRPCPPPHPAPLISYISRGSTLWELCMSPGLPCCALWHQAKGSLAASGFSIFQKLPAFPGFWPFLHTVSQQ